MAASPTVIAFLAVEGGMASSARTAAEIAAYANRGGAEERIALVVASADGRAVRAFGGERLPASYPLSALRGPRARSEARADRPAGAPEGGGAAPDAVEVAAVVIPAVLGPLDPLLVDSRIPAALRALAGEGCAIAATCDAVFLMAASGLLDGSAVPVHPSLRQDFRRRFPSVRVDEGAERYSRDGILLSVGSGTFADLMVEILRSSCGPAVADRCGRVFLDRAGAPAAGPATGEAASAADPVSRAAALMEARYAERLDLDRIAAEVGTGGRTLIRRFKRAYGLTPAAYLRARRCAVAAALLTATDLAVEEISWRVGYADASAFARAFRGYAGASPAAYRAAAGRGTPVRR